MSHVRVGLLGAPRLERDATPIEINTRKALALLAYLVLSRRRHSREALAALLWPEEDPPHARGALRNTLYELNKALGRVGLDITREEVGFVESDDVTVDVVEFHRLLNACQTHGHAAAVVCRVCLEELAQAAALSRDDFLAGFNVDASPEFEEWQLFQTEALRRELAKVLERLTRGHRDRGHFEPALESARRWQSLDLLDEAAQRAVMELYALSGERAAALQSYHELVERLQHELGAAPQAETIELYEAIKTSQFLPAPPPRAAGNLAAHIPPTPFIGREEELARLAHWLDESDAPLLTIVGPGGIGKTHLALHCALAHGARFTHGAYFVPLAPISPELLVSAIAEALDFAFQGRLSPQTQLLNYLRDKHLLLVLDNFEQLRAQASLLTEIVQRAPRLKLLVTSREWLNLSVESILDLEGLPYPETNRPAGAKLEDYSAVQLFVQNARRVHWSFRLPPEARGVERICQLVEGMPLGIELAAAWVRVISCQEIAREIERDLGILATTLGGIPERHRSLRVVFDYSYHRLDPEVQRIFRKLSVFRGGFSRTAAERVAGASLPTLARLVDHSLLQRTAAGRYELHELLRQYGEAQLRAAADETNVTLDAHGAYYAEFLHTRESDLKGRGQREALEAIAEERDNVRAAWQWAVARRNVAAIQSALDSLSLFYWVRHHFREAHDALAAAAQALAGTDNEILLGAILAHQGRFTELLGDFNRAVALHESSLALLRRYPRAAPSEMAFALCQQGISLYRLGEAASAERCLQESLSLYQQLEEAYGQAQVLHALGNVSSGLRGDYARARQWYEQSLALRQAIGDRRGLASAYNGLGAVSNDVGEYAEARQFFDQSIAVSREIGDRYSLALALNNLGWNAQMRHNYREAKRFYEESLAIRQEVGDRYAVAIVLGNLGLVALELGEYAKAQRYLDDSLALHREIDDRPGISEALNGLGKLAFRQGQSQTAWDSFTASLRVALAGGILTNALEALIGFAPLLEPARAVELLSSILDQPAANQDTKDNATRLLAELGAQLSPEVVRRAQGRGRERALEEVAKELLAEAE